MDKIAIYQIDAFTDKVFFGNPAAVCMLDNWLNDELMQAIAVENNLSETAFVIHNDNETHIRWFTPNGEISLCGHATLASAFALFETKLSAKNEVVFSSLSGKLKVSKNGDKLVMNFPQLSYQKSTLNLQGLINTDAQEVYDGELDYLVILKNSKDVKNTIVNLEKLAGMEKRGLIISAPNPNFDFYSRCFYPKHNITEDPVTGSAYCILTPYWAKRLNKNELIAKQGLSREGVVYCSLGQKSVDISGMCRWYSKGHLLL